MIPIPIDLVRNLMSEGGWPLMIDQWPILIPMNTNTNINTNTNDPNTNWAGEEFDQWRWMTIDQWLNLLGEKVTRERGKIDDWYHCYLYWLVRFQLFLDDQWLTSWGRRWRRKEWTLIKYCCKRCWPTSWVRRWQEKEWIQRDWLPPAATPCCDEQRGLISTSQSYISLFLKYIDI